MRTCLAAAALVVGLAACSPGSAGAPSALSSVGATTFSAGGTAGDPVPPGSCHAGDGGFLPDPGCTPGGADARVTPDTLSSTICRSGYTATVRPPLSVTEPIKRERMAAYGGSALPGEERPYTFTTAPEVHHWTKVAARCTAA